MTAGRCLSCSSMTALSMKQATSRSTASRAIMHTSWSTAPTQPHTGPQKAAHLATLTVLPHVAADAHQLPPADPIAQVRTRQQLNTLPSLSQNTAVDTAMLWQDQPSMATAAMLPQSHSVPLYVPTVTTVTRPPSDTVLGALLPPSSSNTVDAVLFSQLQTHPAPAAEQRQWDAAVHVSTTKARRRSRKKPQHGDADALPNCLQDIVSAYAATDPTAQQTAAVSKQTSIKHQASSSGNDVALAHPVVARRQRISAKQQAAVAGMETRTAKPVKQGHDQDKVTRTALQLSELQAMLEQEASMRSEVAQQVVTKLHKFRACGRVGLDAANAERWITFLRALGADPAKALQACWPLLAHRFDAAKHPARIHALQQQGLSDEQIIKVIEKQAIILRCRLEDRQDALQYLRDTLGLQGDNFANWLVVNCQVLNITFENLKGKVDNLVTVTEQHLQWGRAEAVRALINHGRIFDTSQFTLASNVAAWAQYGREKQVDVSSLLMQHPILLYKVNMSRSNCVALYEFAEQMLHLTVAENIDKLASYRYFTLSLTDRLGPRAALAEYLDVHMPLSMHCVATDTVWMRAILTKYMKRHQASRKVDALEQITQHMLSLDSFAALWQQQLDRRADATAGGRLLSKKEQQLFSDEVLLLSAYAQWWQEGDGREWVDKWEGRVK